MEDTGDASSYHLSRACSNSLYDALEVDTHCSVEEIKQSYRRLALVYHPDKVQQKFHTADDVAKAKERFQKIGEAHRILSDPQKRAFYDQFGKRGIEEIVNNNDDAITYIFQHLMEYVRYIRLVAFFSFLFFLLCFLLLFLTCWKMDYHMGRNGSSSKTTTFLWSWGFTWMPLWLLSPFLLLVSLTFLLFDGLPQWCRVCFSYLCCCCCCCACGQEGAATLRQNSNRFNFSSLALGLEVLLACVVIPAAAAAVFDNRLSLVTPLLNKLFSPLNSGRAMINNTEWAGYTGLFALCVLWCVVNLSRNVYECMPRAYARQRRLNRDTEHFFDDDDDDDDDEEEEEDNPNNARNKNKEGAEGERQPLNANAAGGRRNYNSTDDSTTKARKPKKQKSASYMREYILFVLVRLVHFVCLALFVWLCYQRSLQSVNGSSAYLSFWVIFSPLFFSLLCMMTASYINDRLAKRKRLQQDAERQAQQQPPAFHVLDEEDSGNSFSQLFFYFFPQLCVLYTLCFWAAKLQYVVNNKSPNFPLFYYNSAPSAFTASIPFLVLFGLALLLFLIAFIASLCVTKETIEDAFAQGHKGGSGGADEPFGGSRASSEGRPHHSHSRGSSHSHSHTNSPQHMRPYVDDYSGAGVSTYGSVFTSGNSTPPVEAAAAAGTESGDTRRSSSRASSKSQGAAKKATTTNDTENID